MMKMMTFISTVCVSHFQEAFDDEDDDLYFNSLCSVCNH